MSLKVGATLNDPVDVRVWKGSAFVAPELYVWQGGAFVKVWPTVTGPTLPTANLIYVATPTQVYQLTGTTTLTSLGVTGYSSSRDYGMSGIAISGDGVYVINGTGPVIFRSNAGAQSNILARANGAPNNGSFQSITWSPIDGALYAIEETASTTSTVWRYLNGTKTQVMTFTRNKAVGNADDFGSSHIAARGDKIYLLIVSATDMTTSLYSIVGTTATLVSNWVYTIPVTPGAGYGRGLYGLAIGTDGSVYYNVLTTASTSTARRWVPATNTHSNVVSSTGWGGLAVNSSGTVYTGTSGGWYSSGSNWYQAGTANIADMVIT